MPSGVLRALVVSHCTPFLIFVFRLLNWGHWHIYLLQPLSWKTIKVVDAEDLIMPFPSFVLMESGIFPSIRVPIDITIFVSHVLPPFLGYFFLAVLAVIPHTHVLRVSLWPIITLLALRAAVSVDMSLGEPDRKFRNTLFVVSFSFLTNSTQMAEPRFPLHPRSRWSS